MIGFRLLFHKSYQISSKLCYKNIITLPAVYCSNAKIRKKDRALLLKYNKGKTCIHMQTKGLCL